MPNPNTKYILKDTVLQNLTVNGMNDSTGVAKMVTVNNGVFGYQAIPSGGAGVSDGDKGDVTVSGSGATWTIDANAVTLAKMAQVATATFLGRTTAATGNVEALTVAQAKTLLNLTGTNSGDQTITLTGNVTGSGTGSFATTIANNVVTNAMLSQMGANTIKGNNTGASANAADLTGTQVTAMLDTFTTSLKGVVPASGGGTTNFLRADGTWAAPAGGGGGTGTVNSGTANQMTYYGSTGTAVSGVPEFTWDGTTKRASVQTTSGNDIGFFIKNTGTGVNDTATIRLENSTKFATFFISTVANGNSDETGWYTTSGNGYAFLNSAATEIVNFRQDGTVEINAGTLKLPTNSTTRANLTFRSGTLMTTPANGSMEYDGTNLYFTVGSNRMAVNAGMLLNVRFLTSGTSYTPTTGTKSIMVHLVGGGGGGGGVTGAANSVGAAGGGGAGGYTQVYLTGVGAGPYTYAIGAAGTAGANTGTAGGNGGATTFTFGATTYSANGGFGGAGQTAGTALGLTVGGAGASPGTGTLNSLGEAGSPGIRLSGSVGISGSGGASEFSGGGAGLSVAAAGNSAFFGSGGGGALSTANTARAGGSGGAGIIVIYEYS